MSTRYIAALVRQQGASEVKALITPVWQMQGI